MIFMHSPTFSPVSHQTTTSATDGAVTHSRRKGIALVECLGRVHSVVVCPVRTDLIG